MIFQSIVKKTENGRVFRGGQFRIDTWCESGFAYGQPEHFGSDDFDSGKLAAPPVSKTPPLSSAGSSKLPSSLLMISNSSTTRT